MTPRITVGLPVYKCADVIASCLECLQRQTFGDFEAIISVDGGDAETAAACRPFLADPRFRIVVHPERLDWVGNFNWLLQQNLQEFFCYRQHDDTTAPEFFEVLLQAADKEPNAAAVYCDCQYTGTSNHIEIGDSIEGEPLDRMLQYIERRPVPPLRGLIRTAAIRQAALVRSDEFRAPLQVFGWLAKLLCWGNFRRVAQPLYYKLDHPHSFTNQWNDRPEDHRRAVWTTMFTGLLEAAMPLCRTAEQRLFLQEVILYQIVRDYLYWPNAQFNFSAVVAACLERLRHEGNSHLLRAEELPSILEELQRRPATNLLEHSSIGNVIYRIRQRARGARIIYPRSRMRRGIYLLEKLRQSVSFRISRILTKVGFRARQDAP